VTALDELAGRNTCTVPEMAEMLGIGRDAAYAAVAAGTLPGIRVGRRIVVPCHKLRQLLGESPPDTDAATPGRAAAESDSTGQADVELISIVTRIVQAMRDQPAVTS